jgi:hypothetical protein
MNIQLFINKQGIVYGHDNKRIYCDREGVLKIGSTNITVNAYEDNVLPLLFYGATGDYEATFVTNDATYDLGKVTLRNGRILPPPATDVKIMDLTCRADKVERERDEMKEKIEELSHIFDTNSLNFIIK